MATMPFSFLWCYEPEDEEDTIHENVLLLGTPETVTPLHIDIGNCLTDAEKTITINPIDGITEANADHYHYKLAFNAGILVEPEKISVESENWSISFVSENTDSLYLLWIGDPISLPPNEATEVILTGVAAQSEVRTTTTNVTISWQFKNGGLDVEMISVRRPGQGDEYETNTTLTLEMIKTSGKSNIPLFVGFVGANKVLNTHDETNSLQLRITNTNFPGADSDITFHYSQNVSECSQLVVVLEVGTATDVPWALGTLDQVNGVTISLSDKWEKKGTVEQIKAGDIVKALQWTFSPKSADVVLAAQETMLINFSNIKTAHPTGETNLYLRYEYISGYKDGQFTCQIEKAPLVLDTKARIGTRKDLTGLLTVRDGISLDSPGEIQHTGPMIFRSDVDKSNDSTSVLFYNQDQSTPLMCLSKTGDMGIGTASPTAKLDVLGNAVIDGDLGIGTDTPSAKLEVKGRIKDVTGWVMPVGTIVPYGGSSAPQGWWLCDGRDLSKNDWPALFDVIQYTYGGSGDSFKLPDLRGRVPVGLDTTSDFKPLGHPGGEKTHKLTTAEMPSHDHSVTDKGHSHYATIYGNNNDESNYQHYKRGGSDSHGTASLSTAYTGISIQTTGGNGYHNNLQPYLTINYIIKC